MPLFVLKPEGTGSEVKATTTSRLYRKNRMAYWNYRVVLRLDPIEGETYVIHEVYYNEDGEITIWNERPTTVEEGSLGSLKSTSTNMLEALDSPILREVHWDGKDRLVPSK